MAILGTTYVLWVDTVTAATAYRGNPLFYRPIVCGVSNGFNMAVEAISVRNKDDKGFDHSRPGYLTCGFDMDGHALGLRLSERTEKANFNEMALLCKNKVTFWCKMDNMTNPGELPREVLVWISSYKETANNNEIYSFSMSMVGVGEPILEDSIIPVLLATENSLITATDKPTLLNTKF